VVDDVTVTGRFELAVGLTEKFASPYVFAVIEAKVID
jgi:hypothetical protein